MNTRSIHFTNRFTIAQFLLSLIIICPSCQDHSTPLKQFTELTDTDYKHETDTIEGDTLHFKSAMSANTHQIYNPLNDQQKDFIKDRLIDANSLIRTYIPNSNINNYTPKTLDNLIDLWNTDSSKFKCSKDYFINAIGVAFGEYLIKTYKMEWKILTDEDGQDYATTIEEISLTNFPINSVQKAIDQKRDGALTTIFLLTKRDISKLRNGR